MLVFPILFTNRLQLRKIEIDDVPALLKYGNNKRIADRIVNIPHPYDEPQAVFRIAYVNKGFKQKSHFCFAMVLKSSGELIGEISLHLQHDKAELGYWLGEPFWNQGLTSEAIAAVLKFGFERLALQQIYANCHLENVGSWKVLEKNGMLRGGSLGETLNYSISQKEHIKISQA